MKILFSSDWHLGYEMGGANRVERLPDQMRQLELIAGYLEEHEVDVLAVAGDVFEAQERGRALVAVQSMMDALRPSLERGLQVVMIAGNHDRDYFMNTANEWLSVHRAPGSGEFILATRPVVRPIEARGEKVNFVLLPFPTPTRYDIHDLDAGGGVATRNERIASRFIEVMSELQEKAAGERLPTVLLTHLTVEGTEVGPHRISPRDDLVVPRSVFPSFELTVVGHIHKAERLGSGHFYYVGVLDRMDMGEMEYLPRVLLADVGPSGVREMTSLPLDPTTFVEVHAENELQLESAARQIDAGSMVKLFLRVSYGTYTAPLIARARDLFPRLYSDVQHEWVGAPAVEPTVQGLDAADVAGTIQKYLDVMVPDDEERAELVELVEELRSNVGLVK